MRARTQALLLLAALVASGCDQKVRYTDTISVPLRVPGEAATASLEAQLSPALREALGPALPDPWPEWAPRQTLDLSIERDVPVLREDLGKVGEDLAKVGVGEAEARLRAIRYAYDPGTLTHPVVTGELFVLPSEETPLEDPSARRVATLDGLETLREGELVFQPGGRRALVDGLARGSSALRMRLAMDFDTGRSRALPGGEGSLDLEVRIDILR